ncbi:MAG: Gfo/Idh/MocA family oxidoreductase [Xanthobacteraceae bacterium]|nr:Gfo/Idh/MocA family oxidoreductase [Xanthobacteraceae bacterium]
MPIRVAAIEVSHWHSVYDPAYLRQLARMPDVVLVGLQDPSLAVAQKRAAEVGNPPAFADYKQMLREARPDFVLALGRPTVMAEIGHHLLDAEIPFLMEKPMGINADQVRGLAAKADARQGFAALPTPQRHTPFYAEARAMLDRGAFGPLSHIYLRTIGFSSARYPAWDCPWMLDPAAACGGALRNLGTHGFDTFRQLTGEDAEVIAAQISNRALGQPVEDYAVVLVRSESGVLGTIEVGNTFPRRSRESHSSGSSSDKLLDGGDGEMKISGRDAMLVSKAGQLRIVTADGEQTKPGIPAEMPSYRILEETLACWRRGEPPPASVHDGYRAAKMIDDAYRIAARAG